MFLNKNNYVLKKTAVFVRFPVPLFHRKDHALNLKHVFATENPIKTMTVFNDFRFQLGARSKLMENTEFICVN